MNMIATTPAAPSEAGVLACELATSFGQMLHAYEEQLKLTRAEAIQRTEANPDGAQRSLSCPPDQVSWYDLRMIARTDPDRATARWEEMKRAALDELRTGHRSALALKTGCNDAWQRARFLAVREDLAVGLQPRNGVEWQLIDMMAEARTFQLQWLEKLTDRISLISICDSRLKQEEASWQGPRQTEADAIHQAAEMADRFNRMFLRALHALRDLRRDTGHVTVKKGGQLNVAQQQVNMASASPQG